MKKINLILVLLIVMGCNNSKTKNSTTSEKALDCTYEWFKAWELVSGDVFKLKENKPSRFVFFDNEYVYTTSPLTGKGGKIIEGPQLFGEKQTWYKKAHKGTLLLPDGSETKVEMMIFANSTNEKTVKAFFVMPLLSFWEKEKIGDHNIGLDKLTAGVFTHEFSHTQQLSSFDKFGTYFDNYQKKYDTTNFGDDMMQDIFEKDAAVNVLYNNELKAFTKATLVDNAERKAATLDALKKFQEKHTFIFNRDKKDLKLIDDIWLTMEGIGQYAMYEYLINPKGANLSKDKAYAAMKTKSWSQEEGFELFILLAKYKNPELWANRFFGSEMQTIVETLKNEVN